ncbi:MAG TPA: tetratricopeptide repeat protein [Steroidobacteraceae bacterium]
MSVGVLASVIVLGGVLATSVATAASPAAGASARASGAAAAGAPEADRAAIAPERCAALHKRGRRPEAHACYERLILQAGSAPRVVGTYWRAEGEWALGDYGAANRDFRDAVAGADAEPARPPAGAPSPRAVYRVRWGLLLHERFNDSEAVDLFNEARAREPKYAPAYLALARVSADGFDNRAIEWTRKALEIDPRLTAAHELLASLALEDSDPALAAREADAALAIAPDEALDALAVHASIELLADRPPDRWFERMGALNASYGEGYALAAHQLILAMRYTQGVAYYRKALATDPELWSARSDLGINLLRLGDEAGARAELVRCYDAGYRSPETVNTLRLIDTLSRFVTIREPGIILKLDEQEAPLLRPYFLEQLNRDIADYDRKYHMKLPGPVRVEVYPNHEDFAVRTLGVPGLGALGVTFGEVVAMDSPSGRKPGDFHWASTLRHEMSHVYILTATNHRVPRWFTEGLAVHEETQASPEWGDPMTPDIVAALRDHKLLPVADLDRGFVRPSYPGQVQVSYFEAGRVCDFIQSRWGVEKLNAMVHAYALRKTTREVIAQTLSLTPEAFDQQFQAWLYASVGTTVGNLPAWHAALAELARLAHAGRNDAVIGKGDAVIRLYPDYVYDDNAYELLADAYLARENRPKAIEVLRRYEHAGGRSPQLLEKLAGLEQDAGDSAAAAATLERINLIDPAFDQAEHRKLGDLWLAQKNYAGAIREYQAVLAFHPLDQASARLDLARAYLAAGERNAAEDSVLAALEAAPDYRPAQKLLLELEGKKP